MKASIIIRTKNEERWISSCLESVFSQDYSDFEVVLVDNLSGDATVAKALQYPIQLVQIETFRPGLAINEGIRASRGELIVCLSGHCIPARKDWLYSLLAPLQESLVGGVYGRQQPMSFTTDRDKRDLLITFGLDPKRQRKDTFFHNANSAFRRETWEKYPFDEETPHIEDRLWARDILTAGMEIYYEPAASVYHFHGIHQDDNPQRRRNIVQILESFAAGEENVTFQKTTQIRAPDPQDLNTVALIPIRGGLTYVGNKPLLAYTLEHTRQSRFIDRVFVLTDRKEVADFATQNGAEAPFLRPAELSREFVTISDVLKFGVEELKNWEIYPDLCVMLEVTYPFRPPGFIDEMVIRLLREGTQSVMAVREEQRSVWAEKNGGFEALVPMKPRTLKSENIFVGLFGLGFVTYPAYIYDGSLGMDKMHVYAIDDPVAQIEIRNQQQWDRVTRILRSFNI